MDTSPPHLGQHVNATGVVVPEGSVVITPREMYAEIEGTRKAVERLVATIDPTLAEIRGDVAAVKQTTDTLTTTQNSNGTRITTLEVYLKAAWAVLGLLIACVSVYVAAVH